jgi:hypothetical protein
MVIPASVAVWQVLQQPLGWRRGVVVGLLALLMALGIKDSVRKERCAAKRAGVMLTTAFAAAGGALATYVLAQYTPLGSIAASGVVGLGAAYVLRRSDLSTAAYAGAFVGMSSPAVLSSLPVVAIAGLVTGVLYETLDGIFDGVGGRLGTMAAIAVLVTLLAAGGGWS